MYKLALVGKNISHSLSPKIYFDLLKGNVEYQLLDYDSSEIIPTAAELLNHLDGFSITSPYKEHFLNQVELVGESKILQAINCVRKRDNTIEATNTDYLAILEILKRDMLNFSDVIILGDGVMSRVTQHALRNLKIDFQIFSRKLNTNFSNLNLSKIVGKGSALIINTCSRDYVYKNELHANTIFWDYNYNFVEQSELISKNCKYIDGKEMLLFQAKYALEFWSIK